MSMENLSEAQIYVGTYAKYNDGSLFGKWLELSDYADKEEFQKACKELHSDEIDPEFMFQDWECIPDCLICESWLSDNFFTLRGVIEKLTDTEQEAFMVWCNDGSHDLNSEDCSDLIESFRGDYVGEYDKEEDFAYQLVDECYDLPDFALSYFDYAKFARDLFIGDYWYSDGFVFSSV
jgi:antirestriction protein